METRRERITGSIHCLAVWLLLLPLAGCSSQKWSNENGSSADDAGLKASSTAAEPQANLGEAGTTANELPNDDLFVDATSRCGILFVHYNGLTGEYTLPEITGSGCALLDYDNDGDLDLYLVQGAVLQESEHPNAVKWTASKPPCDRLLRNDLLSDGSHFIDVTDQCGILAEGYGMGVATGDFDNDGWIDLYVTNLESNQLWRNNADGTFSDVTAQAGVDDARWSSSATFFDYDRDGNPDLYVANYVDFSFADGKECFGSNSARDFCGPRSYDPVSDRLFHNLGGGKFEDVTARAGIDFARGPGLGVIAADFDGDDWTDLYVANDGQPNQLWINQQGDGTFEDESLLAGVAVNHEGKAEAGMGVDAADFDGDGDSDLMMMHLQNESNTLYTNQGDGYFEDRTISTGLHAASLSFTAFGGGFLDYDNDGWLDIFTANGAVRIIQALKPHPYPLQQTNQLFRNNGRGGFVELTSRAGIAFEVAEVSRGAAFGDIDNDGDTDVVVLNSYGPARLLLNNLGNLNHWLGLRVLEEDGLRDAMQARVEVVLNDGRTLWRRVYTDGSYCSARDPRVLIGLGSFDQPQAVRIHWIDGTSDEFTDLAVDRYWQIRRGRPAVQLKGKQGTGEE